jgi:hypothetical protein
MQENNEDTYQVVQNVNLNKPIWINKKQEKPKKNISIFVATPVHSECSIHYTQSLLQFQQTCMLNNIYVTFTLLKSSLVTQGRNLCVNGLLEAGDKYDYLLFIDSDIEFRYETIMKMIEADKDIIACPYPLKNLDWHKISKRIKRGESVEPGALATKGYTWPVKVENQNEIKVEHGVAEVAHAPTGCMLIKRSVFEKMIKAYPEKKISQPTIMNGEQVDKEFYYNFFDTLHDPDTKRYFGEDFGFCRRWTKIGGKCHIYVEDYITHVGEYKYEGRIKDDMEFDK